MNKRGSDWFFGLHLDLIIVITLTVLLFAIFFPMIANFLAVDTEDESVKTGLDALAKKIREMIADPDNYVNTFEINSLKSGYVLTGFGNEQDEYGARVIGIVNYKDMTVSRPEKCFGKPCLCLFEGEPSKENLVSCNTFNEQYGNIVFLGYSDSLPKGNNANIKLNDRDELVPQYLYMTTVRSFTESAGITDETRDYQTYYIERVRKPEDPDTSYVLISFELGLDEREKIMHICREGSDGLCGGRPFGSVVRDDGDDIYYCYNIGSDICKKDHDIENCPEGETTSQKCACGDFVMQGDLNTCTEGEIYNIDCEQYTECKDYCLGPSCTSRQKELCKTNPCVKDIICEIKTFSARLTSTQSCVAK